MLRRSISFIIILTSFLSTLTLCGQEKKLARIFKEEFNVEKFQNQQITINIILKSSSNDSLGTVVRGFFDDANKRNLGYETCKTQINHLENKWLQLKGTLSIPNKTKILDLAILTSNFPYTINIAQLIVTDKEGTLVKDETGFENTERNFEIFNYDKAEDSNATYQNKNTLLLTIQKSILYGNNLEIGKRINVNGIDFYYEIYGEGEPILLLHGNNESINSFRFQIDSLKSKYRVIAVDSRCQGRTSCNDVELSYDQMANDMNTFMESLKIENYSILGWSDGGNTGMTMALKYPSKITKLITMGANLYPDHGALDPEFLKTFKSNYRKTRFIGVFNKSMKKNARVTQMCFKYPNIKPESLQSLTMPVLILAGETDVITKQHTELIAKSIPKSELYIFPNASHYAPIEIPRKFNEIVFNFLDE